MPTTDGKTIVYTADEIIEAIVRDQMAWPTPASWAKISEMNKKAFNDAENKRINALIGIKETD